MVGVGFRCRQTGLPNLVSNVDGDFVACESGGERSWRQWTSATVRVPGAVGGDEVVVRRRGGLFDVEDDEGYV